MHAAVPVSKSAVTHLLRRAGFAATPADVRRYMRGTSMASVVDALLEPTRNQPAVRPPELDDPDVADWERWVAVVKWWLDRMATCAAPVQEKLALFWHGHFCSSLDKVGDMRLMYDQNALFRSAGLGSFRNL